MLKRSNSWLDIRWRWQQSGLIESLHWRWQWWRWWSEYYCHNDEDDHEDGRDNITIIKSQLWVVPIKKLDNVGFFSQVSSFTRHVAMTLSSWHVLLIHCFFVISCLCRCCCCSGVVGDYAKFGLLSYISRGKQLPSIHQLVQYHSNDTELLYTFPHILISAQDLK